MNARPLLSVSSQGWQKQSEKGASSAGRKAQPTTGKSSSRNTATSSATFAPVSQSEIQPRSRTRAPPPSSESNELSRLASNSNHLPQSNHPMIKTKSTDDPMSKRDGLRIFATRYWPRGHKREECHEWIPSLAPSERLLKQIQTNEITWNDFQREYRAEMLKGFSDESHRNPRMRNSGQKYFLRMLRRISAAQTITLICTCPPGAEYCHRRVLQDLLQK